MADRPDTAHAVAFSAALSGALRATPFGRMGKADQIGMLRRAAALGVPQDTARKMLADALQRPRCPATGIGE